jgi:hypothetical protein
MMWGEEGEREEENGQRGFEALRDKRHCAHSFEHVWKPTDGAVAQTVPIKPANEKADISQKAALVDAL